MNHFLVVVLLGVIEGITEFLPISSTGHLLVAEHWLGQRSDLFNIAIQVGAILSVVVIYWRRLLDLAFGFARVENRDYLYKLSAAFGITLAGGFVAKQLGLKLPETVAPVAWALIVGGVLIVIIERTAGRQPERIEVTWRVAVAVGLSQIVAAVFPGTSRSAATIFAAMLAGLTARPAATEFAFLVGIPTMFAASAYEFLKQLKTGALHQENMPELGVGFAVSAIVAFLAVKWLLKYIQSHRFTAFAWYRILAGTALLVFLH
jgi:undecaprenyl-diphosphatase